MATKKEIEKLIKLMLVKGDMSAVDRLVAGVLDNDTIDTMIANSKSDADGSAQPAKSGGAKKAKNPNWKSDPASDAQKSALKKKGLTFPDDLTKGEADTLFNGGTIDRSAGDAVAGASDTAVQSSGKAGGASVGQIKFANDLINGKELPDNVKAKNYTAETLKELTSNDISDLINTLKELPNKTGATFNSSKSQDDILGDIIDDTGANKK